jgi:hypothetical protein
MLIPAQNSNKANCKIQDCFVNRQIKKDVKCNKGQDNRLEKDSKVAFPSRNVPTTTLLLQPNQLLGICSYQSLRGESHHMRKSNDKRGRRGEGVRKTFIEGRQRSHK